MPAFAYLRKSSVHDPSRVVSFEMQEAAVRSVAGRHGDADDLVILHDWDKSGRLGPDKRPGYRALLDAIESGKATAVYSYSLSRLARSVQELSRLIADCDRRGVPVRLDVDAIDTSTASGKLLTHVLAAVAQFESDVARERQLAANAAKAAKGLRVGTAKRYGEKPGEDAHVVVAAFREAGSYSGAARLLNDRAVPCRNGRRGWWPSSVSVVVKRMIPTEVRRPTKGARAGGSDFVLAGLMVCPVCGTRMTGTRDRDGRRVRYSCRMGSARPHPRVSVSEHLILGTIKAEVARLRVPGSRFEELDADEAAIRSLEERRTRVVDLYESGLVDRAERDRRIAVITDEMVRLDARRVVEDIPDRVDWEWDARTLNVALRAIFRGITLDPQTFQPVAFEWLVERWRAA